MNDIGLYGLGVMGVSLARNIANRGYHPAVYNIDKEVTHRVCTTYPDLTGYDELSGFVKSLKKPRKIMIMVTAGKAVDEVCTSMRPLLEEGDILIDCGNSYYKDTERRQKELEPYGLRFIGAGVSGGEKGALNGPSIMPSGEYKAYACVQEILTAMAAKNPDGSPCCTYIGNGGSGHFVKMVHNGIEYADMQLIAEFYAIFKKLYHGDHEKIADVFQGLNTGYLSSYLLDITVDILRYQEDGEYLVDRVLDIAKQKGTGKWTAQAALEYDIAVPSLLEAVQARFLSCKKQERIQAEQLYSPQCESIMKEESLRPSFTGAMLCAKTSIYAQGFSLIQAVSDDKQYEINQKGLAEIWQNGCIIKSEFLKKIEAVYEKDPDVKNLLLSDVCCESMTQYRKDANKIICFAQENGLYTPVLSSAIQYLNGYVSGCLETNLIQAQRDCFGAHTYQRVDKDGVFHSEWVKE